MLTKFAVGLAIIVVPVLLPSAALAQGLETLGARATALGAFVAVADDVSAVAWNPAGLVHGPIVNMVWDVGRSTQSTAPAPLTSGEADRVGSALIGIGLPPIGLSYYRIRTELAETPSPAASSQLDRQNEQVVLRSLVTNHLGATVLQSLGDYITVGATAKIVRGRVATGMASVDSWHDAFEQVERLDGRGSTTGDIDIGAMVAGGSMRAGVVIRNVTEPRFSGADGTAVGLEREARVGVAWGDGWPGLARTIVAIDADATRVASVGGARREVAAGVERWWRGRRLAVRGGLRVSTLGDARPAASGGVSVALRAGMYADTYVTLGRQERVGWGVAARVSY